MKAQARKARFKNGLALAAFFLSLSCTKKQNTPSENQSPAQALSSRGRTIYVGNCIACHGGDPKKDGNLGPAVYGSSLELLEARVLRGEYPPNYTPKRTTRTMVPMPQLKNEIDALHAYLNSP